jgi:hypothetical protein
MQQEGVFFGVSFETRIADCVQNAGAPVCWWQEVDLNVCAGHHLSAEPWMEATIPAGLAPSFLQRPRLWSVAAPGLCVQSIHAFTEIPARAWSG